MKKLASAASHCTASHLVSLSLHTQKQLPTSKTNTMKKKPTSTTSRRGSNRGGRIYRAQIFRSDSFKFYRFKEFLSLLFSVINPTRIFGAAVIYGKDKAWDDSCQL